jgi:purine-binding chemotaxis protein CheW
MGTDRQYCTFTLGKDLYGLEVGRVQEVLRNQETTRVPLAKPIIRGLINLRGQIVMAIDLRHCLGLESSPTDRAPMNLVLRTEDAPISLLVDAIHDVITVASTSVEPPPAGLREPANRLVRGTYVSDGRLILFLEADGILAMIEEEAAG